MNFRPRRAEDPEINLTPLIDVVFLLLIFFMVSTSFKHESAFDVSLPEASSDPVATASDALEIQIDAEGRYAVDGAPLEGGSVEHLMGTMQELADGRTDLAVVIRADGSAPHEAVVRAMDAAGRLGLREIAIATVHRPAP